MLSVSVVIPAKNEATGLARLLPELTRCDFVGEVIVVNDGSTDSTVELCAENNVRCISHPYSKGNGASIKTGARHASNDTIVFMDGDGQHQVSDIPKLLAMYQEGYDLVVGARVRSGQASKARAFGNGVYNKFASWMTGRKIPDLTSGFRVVNTAKFREFLYMLPNGFSYPTTSTMAFIRTGYSVGFAEIDVLQREGKSHLNVVRDGVKFLLIIFKIATLYSPIKLFSLIAAGLFLVGSGYYGYTYIVYERFTNMGMLLMLSATIVFVIGLVSEQISTLLYRN